MAFHVGEVPEVIFRDRFLATRPHGKSGARRGTRTPTDYSIRPSNVRVYQFRHPSMSSKKKNPRAKASRVKGFKQLLPAVQAICRGGI